MNKITKSILSFGTIASASVPMAVAFSCGKGNGQYDKSTLVVQAEKAWVPTYEKIIEDFKKTHEDDMKTAGIKNIIVKESGSFDVEKTFSNKGMRDPSTPDLFLLAGDKIDFYNSNSYLAPFQETSTDDFEKDRLGGDTFLAATESLQNALLKNGKLYGVPQNVESMIKFKKTNSNPSKTVTRFSDLWMSAGYFNTINATNDFNLRDIIWTDQNDGTIKTIWSDTNQSHGTIANAAEADEAIKSGFSRIISASSGITNVDAFDKDSAKASPKIYEYANDNSAAVFAGPWDKEAISKILGTTVPEAIETRDNWVQWGGGWGYGINARRTNQSEVIKLTEKLIAEFLNSNNASEIYNNTDKISPTTNGKTKLNSTTQTNRDTIKAIYDTASLVKPKPEDSAFGTVWDAYANTISNKANELIKGTRKTNLSEELKQEFIDAVKAAAKAENDKNKA